MNACTEWYVWYDVCDISSQMTIKIGPNANQFNVFSIRWYHMGLLSEKKNCIVLSIWYLYHRIVAAIHKHWTMQCFYESHFVARKIYVILCTCDDFLSISFFQPINYPKKHTLLTSLKQFDIMYSVHCNQWHHIPNIVCFLQKRHTEYRNFYKIENCCAYFKMHFAFVDWFLRTRSENLNNNINTFHLGMSNLWMYRMKMPGIHVLTGLITLKQRSKFECTIITVTIFYTKLIHRTFRIEANFI